MQVRFKTGLGFALALGAAVNCGRSSKSVPPGPAPAADSSAPAADSSSVPSLPAADAAAADESRRAKSKAEAQAAMLALSARLVELRDRAAAAQDPKPCERFEPLGPRLLHAEAARLGQCAPATNVHCVQSSSGFFVPVADPYAPSCSWALWFVPSTAATLPVVRGYNGFSEGPDQFTSSMTLSDLDRDGTEEVAVAREDKTPRAEAKIVLVRPGAEPSDTPFSELRDTDGDGRADGVSRFVKYLGAAEDKSLYLRAPTIILHRTKEGAFALDDAAACRQRHSAFRAPLTPLVASRGSSINQDESARRVVCSLLAGAERATVERELASGCELAKRAEPGLDCDVFLGDLTVFMDRTSELVRWGRHSERELQR